jgi:hypothetical protein
MPPGDLPIFPPLRDSRKQSFDFIRRTGLMAIGRLSMFGKRMKLACTIESEVKRVEEGRASSAPRQFSYFNAACSRQAGPEANFPPPARPPKMRGRAAQSKFLQSQQMDGIVLPPPAPGEQHGMPCAFAATRPPRIIARSPISNSRTDNQTIRNRKRMPHLSLNT